MLFVTIRLIFWGLAFIICFLLIKKSHIINKRKWSLVAFVVAIILTTVSALIPIEDAFVTFSSPESAFGYVNTGNVKLVVSGKKTDFVIAGKSNTDIYVIIPKSNIGWKLGLGLDTKRIIQKISDGITIYVYQYKNSDDYYITVFDTNGGTSEITDNHGSEFYYLDKTNNALNKTFYIYYAYVENLNDTYILTVNGKVISVAVKGGKDGKAEIDR